jgi:hypothetical protein
MARPAESREKGMLRLSSRVRLTNIFSIGITLILACLYAGPISAQQCLMFVQQNTAGPFFYTGQEFCDFRRDRYEASANANPTPNYSYQGVLQDCSYTILAKLS